MSSFHWFGFKTLRGRQWYMVSTHPAGGITRYPHFGPHWQTLEDKPGPACKGESGVYPTPTPTQKQRMGETNVEAKQPTPRRGGAEKLANCYASASLEWDIPQTS